MDGHLVQSAWVSTALARRRPAAPARTPERAAPDAGSRDLEISRRLIQSLRQPSCYEHPCAGVEVLETHLSWVLLTGSFAYKIKKPVSLGFADFTTLARRHNFCELELRLNRRLAPELYRDVVAITGTPDAPRIGGDGPVIDYAVRMAQFPQDRLAAAQLQRRQLDGRHIDRLALNVAAFHARIPWAGPATGRGDPASVHAAVRQNFAQLRELPGLESRRKRAAALERWSEARFNDLAGVLRRRQHAGYVRECHGDLHLGNMALLDDRLVMFDCIEFNPALRWIDTASEIAFVVMDLLRRGAPAFAYRFLNGYLEATGDYEALQVLDYFLVYRAMVRAKVAAIRASQSAGTAARAAALAEARAYLALAHGFTRRRLPALVITHGVSGSGKTTLTQALVEQLGLIRVRSDVERKRLFGFGRTARIGSGVGQGIYHAEATARTYAALEERAAALVRAGCGTVVDATFLKRQQRARFAALARQLGCPFRVIAFQAPAEILRRRVAGRISALDEASEATPAVLNAQLQACEAPAGDEWDHTIFVDSESPDAAAQLVRAIDAGQCGNEPAGSR